LHWIDDSNYKFKKLSQKKILHIHKKNKTVSSPSRKKLSLIKFIVCCAHRRSLNYFIQLYLLKNLICVCKHSHRLRKCVMQKCNIVSSTCSYITIIHRSRTTAQAILDKFNSHYKSWYQNYSIAVIWKTGLCRLRWFLSLQAYLVRKKLVYSTYSFLTPVK